MKSRIVGIILVILGLLAITVGSSVRTILGVVGETTRGVFFMFLLFFAGIVLVIYGIKRLIREWKSS